MVHGTAAKICDNLTLGGYSDWFLPSKDELNKIYENLHNQGIGGFVNSSYWSSTEHDNVNAACQRFDNGNQPTNSKSHSFHVRAVRTFIQKTYVPDDNFEAYLEANLMGDGIANNNYVTTANIIGVTNLDLSNNSNGLNISNLTGIEDFSALTALNCNYNQITRLDITQNTVLTRLWCNNNQLTSLNVRNGNNINFTNFDATGNSNLNCVSVDDATWATANWTYIDSHTSFSNDCGGGFEDFTNSNAINSFTDGSFVGNSSITWTYKQSSDGRGDANNSGISLPALTLNYGDPNSPRKITSSTISGGLGDFSIKLYKGKQSSGNRQVELFVNGVSKGTSTIFDDYNEHIFTVSGINISGDIVIEISNIYKPIIIDDISWTGYTLDANFFADTTTICQGNTISFTDASVGNPTSWNWDFGDGTTSTLQNPTNTYTNSGNYAVSLSVIAFGNTDTETKTSYITVNSELDWANLQHPANGSITCNETFDIYGQVYEPGLTNADPNAPGIGLTVEFGYSNSN